MLLSLTSTCSGVFQPLPGNVTPIETVALDMIAKDSALATQEAYISAFITSPSISIPMAGIMTEDDISITVLNAWLEKFTKNNIEPTQRLSEFKIIKVGNSSTGLNCARSMGAEFMAEGFYSVRPIFGISGSEWVAGSGNLDEVPGWITNKVSNFAVFKTGDQYFMKLTGIGGC